MKKSILTGIFLISGIGFSLYAQSGPAGVGTSANNVLWLKADAGTSTTTDGANISFWNDQSGNGINASQSVSSQKPNYKATLMNGMPAVEFDNTTTAGNNDFLSAPDNTILDNTSGYTFFTVTRMKNLDGNARCVVSKRTSIDVDEAFMLFYYTSNYFHLDIDGLGNRFSTTPTAYAVNTNYIMDVVYDGSLVASDRSKIYEGETLRAMSTETSATVPDKPSPLMIGSTHTGDNRPFGGFISEIIIYRTALNDASRVIVNNYLSAKYNIALSANNKYAGDDPANGDYDRQVAGVGKEASGSNNAFNASVSGGLGMTVSAGLDNGDYIMVGHNLVTNANIFTDVSVVSGGPIDSRWQRIWYLDVTNTSTSVTANLAFDLSDGGFAGLTPGPASNYKLLYRTGTSGIWTIVATATSVSADQVNFAGYSFASNSNDGYYTIGTLNNNISPLPVALLSFEAILNVDQVNLDWATASEQNSAYYAVERSKDSELWAEITRVNAAGNTNQLTTYADIDPKPLKGISYYRLKQTDVDGAYTYSNIAVVKNNLAPFDMTPFPNPSDGNHFSLEFSGFGDEDVLVVIRDIQGRQYYSRIHALTDQQQIVAIDLDNRLSAGIYLVIASSAETLVSKKITVKQ